MLITGPCTLETYEQGLRDAQECKRLGIEYFRAGVFKPRTNPMDFQGLREEGMTILKRIKNETGVKVVTSPSITLRTK